MNDINVVCDYIITKCSEGKIYIDLLKLQKLLYYCQSWSLAYDRGPLFAEKFQAWVHGPVSRKIYDRFIAKGMYSQITAQDVNKEMCEISPDDALLISSVLSSYGKYTGDQLEYLTHLEKPWLDARDGLPPTMRSEREISEETMKKFYAERIQKNAV